MKSKIEEAKSVLANKNQNKTKLKAQARQKSIKILAMKKISHMICNSRFSMKKDKIWLSTQCHSTQSQGKSSQ
jgi:hypothetical protein